MYQTMPKTRRVAYIAVFGSLWGVAEIFLGSYLNVLKIPMYGALMALIGVLIVLTGYLFVEGRGSILAMGCVTVFLKLFSIGSLVISPMFAILAEAALGELVFLIFGKHRFSFALAGACMVGYCFFHRFLSQIVFYGTGIVEIYMEFIKMGNKLFGISIEHAVIIIALIFLIHIIIGTAGGFFAWRLAHLAKQRMGLIEQ